MGERIMVQSVSGATASLVVTFDELPKPVLWNDEDRNPGERQPRASSTITESSLSWRPYLRDWVASLRSRRRAEGTACAYERCATRVLERVGKEDLRDVRYEDVEKALASLEKGREGGWAPNTLNVYIASLRSFWKYVVVKRDLGEFGVKDVGAKLEPMTGEVVDRAKVQHPVLTRTEFLSVVRLAESQGETDFALAMRFAWTTVARVSDVANLTWDQLDLGVAPKVAYAKPSKRGSHIVKLLDLDLARRLKALQRLRTPSSTDRVFAKGDEPSKAFRGRFDRRFKRLACEAGLSEAGKYVHPHLIRASAATHATVAGCPELFVQRQGGWKPRTALDAYRREDPETWRKWVVELALD